ncbi:MAG: hypothetical protein ACJATN_000146 [Neolewinella sp.]|jgi:hypothetical protein
MYEHATNIVKTLKNRNRSTANLSVRKAPPKSQRGDPKGLLFNKIFGLDVESQNFSLHPSLSPEQLHQ